MPFPLAPVNGEQTTQNGIVYIYNATLGVWAVLTNTAGNISAGNIVVTNSIASDTVTATGNITGGNLRTSGVTIDASAVTGVSTLSATGTVTVGNVSTAGTVSATGNKKDSKMKLQELDSKTKTQQTRKVLESYFGQQLDVGAVSVKTAKEMLKKIRGLIREHRGTPQFHRSEKNPAYLKMVVMEQALESRIRESQPGAAPGMAMAQQDPRQAAAAAQADAKSMSGGIRKAAAATGTQANPLARAVSQAALGKTLDQTQKKAMAGFAAGIGAAMKDPQQATRLQQMLKTATASAMEGKRARRLKEASEIQQAQVVLAAQDMVDQVQKMIEVVLNMLIYLYHFGRF